jgi:hypothetical protein
MTAPPAWVLQELRVHAEDARRALSASSAAVSVYEPEDRRLRTCVNVGALAAGEAAWPGDELYPLTEYPAAAGLVAQRRAYAFGLGNGCDASSRALAQRLGRRSQLAVPIEVGDRVWGELWLSTGPDRPDLCREHVAPAAGVAARVSAFLELAGVPAPRQRVGIVVRGPVPAGVARRLGLAAPATGTGSGLQKLCEPGELGALVVALEEAGVEVIDAGEVV